MKIAVFGIGGVGGVVGGALARLHDETYFFARGENLRAIREGGLQVESAPLGNFTVQPKLVSDDAAVIGSVDVLLVTSKGYDMGEVCRTAAPMVAPATVVIPLLNGVNVPESMEPHLPPCILASGLIRIYCHQKKPGLVFHQSGGAIAMGMRDGGAQPALNETAALLTEAGIPSAVSGDILLDVWKKYVNMCGNSTVYCWFDAPAGAVRQKSGYEGVIRAIVGELVSVAAAKGIRLPADTIDNQVEAFSKAQPETVTSLYRDLSGGKPAKQTELAHLVGMCVQMGKETGVSTPYHQAVFDKYVG
ncbi:MAG: 2-dehydropantoate 2-reductase [Peptococcaceae bacterium]|jgi:2-dehydropantoate 2-reductase|nr:2-dehydropantoate 2-reductase [Peptococcaceae bacterium]